jgi:ABC-type transporter Mla subunit MlaD
MLPWLQQLGESTLQTVSQTGKSIATSLRQLRRKGSKTASSGPTVGLQLQKNSQQLGRLLKRVPNPLQKIERSQRQLQRSMHSLTKSSLRLFKQLTPSKGRRSSSRRSQRRR